MPRSKEQFQEMREKTRTAILNAALQLFARKGFAGTSINDIAKEAKISKGLAYNYFESKQKILTAIYEELMDEGVQFIKIMESFEDPYEKIKSLIEFTFKYYEENEERWKLYTSLIFQPDLIEEARKLSTEFSGKYMSMFVNILSSIGFKNPALEVRFMNALLDGIGLDYFFEKTAFPLNEMKEHLLKRYSREGIEKLKNAGLLE